MRLIPVLLIIFVILAALMPLSKEFEDDHDYSEFNKDEEDD